MSDAVGADVVITRSSETYAIVRTLPDQLLRHDISDEELAMLCERKADREWEGMWALGGIALGSLPSALAAVSEYLANPERSLGLLDLFQVVLVVTSGAVALTLFIIAHRRGKDAGDLRRQIRERTNRQAA